MDRKFKYSQSNRGFHEISWKKEDKSTEINKLSWYHKP